jgi:hypothetical protein
MSDQELCLGLARLMTSFTHVSVTDLSGGQIGCLQVTYVIVDLSDLISGICILTCLLHSIMTPVV